MPEANDTFMRQFATLAPVDSADKLERWWRPNLSESQYRAHKIKVVSFERTQDTVYLNFELAGDKARAQQLRQFRVDLHRATELVWSELPSTVAHATKDQYAFLMLSEKWYRDNELSVNAFAEPGDKWPFGAELPS
ncbi:hypothetical protein [Hyalangium rubrum]|uniref:Uncharacterized protein n=1 Tax=Hyalangium rubrum TaxID=3103134 RepID=A0ABU5H0H7_9BACT|nr:hypothetical protein [Hyalangium sp. s54d21]MDY7226958.1 hypothetical protein [Hyalangium sp. s54d21]